MMRLVLFFCNISNRKYNLRSVGRAYFSTTCYSHTEMRIVELPHVCDIILLIYISIMNGVITRTVLFSVLLFELKYIYIGATCGYIVNLNIQRNYIACFIAGYIFDSTAAQIFNYQIVLVIILCEEMLSL